MKQSQFEARHQEQWAAFEATLEQLERRDRSSAAHGHFSQRYRRLCTDLALAQERHYSSHLIERLRHLALRGHQQLYRPRNRYAGPIAAFILRGFPRQVRANRGIVLGACATLFGTLALVALLVAVWPDLVYSVLAPDKVSEMEQMYDAGQSHLGRAADRASTEDWMMFGFYIMNNIGIAFQTFASGLLLGLGSLFYLFYNGLQIGAVAGHLSGTPAATPFWSFVIGHGAFELTAIALAGAAGLRLGWALVAPGRLSRGEALRQAASQALQLVYGVAMFLLIAAFLEAYWSSKGSIAPAIKFAVGALLWALVIAYLCLAGRGEHEPD
ncbi:MULTISPECIES: stage II sporulation protein M [unclassified Pseudomonas]|uniref:stage II sporulation protein M n=1 Tax=unclassified Pseudomonas TaxID=196821 RepID=UPI000BC70B6B|nr:MULTISPECIES: stage II sporulation protein M [unclassified Pseudomonas]PVZ11196.1 putative membrane protein SpoIIM required for sporulation [Pseudomonas sp. URIL14HWK12:I12]PVZ22194.1 putative membrane protein SpoIIM required for sporulation [Pseudomonas sp. URIL14HWK12:I10]PVZ31682.1 putative membrane protein SpoIIM required for sporulation [Pseudomonas sp. URIL14HWK12:I11]SNZ16793.1 Uncharacterized membrane protein SpoIIM, required for sporulation [Pseudomonas sp. URIL14HWK12:I9]